jgi:DNA-binding response OmpR family regulator
MPLIHILLIDDDLDTLHAFRMLLERRGYVITITRTIEQAKALASRCEFDLIVTDVAFPLESGYELLKTIRTRADVPAVAVTARGMFHDRTEIFRAGFNSFLLKPVNVRDLEVAIQQALGGNRMREPAASD